VLVRAYLDQLNFDWFEPRSCIRDFHKHSLVITAAQLNLVLCMYFDFVLPSVLLVAVFLGACAALCPETFQFSTLESLAWQIV